MKRVVLLAAIAVASFGLYSFNTVPSNDVNTEAFMQSSFTLINDTGSAVSIHTGSGFVTLNKGGKTSISCNTGKEVRYAESGKKLDLIFKISSDMCGKTIKLSNY